MQLVRTLKHAGRNKAHDKMKQVYQDGLQDITYAKMLR